ncbi:hypothetical protein GS582_06310, partial [Rhodococcus hoagii]|nr:hypothetical protein [Prescottella equi]
QHECRASLVRTRLDSGRLRVLTDADRRAVRGPRRGRAPRRTREPGPGQQARRHARRHPGLCRRSGRRRRPEQAGRTHVHRIHAHQLLPPRPVDADVTFTAEVVRAGRSVAVARVTSTGSDGRECAVATVTCRRPSR